MKNIVKVVVACGEVIGVYSNDIDADVEIVECKVDDNIDKIIEKLKNNLYRVD